MPKRLALLVAVFALAAAAPLSALGAGSHAGKHAGKNATGNASGKGGKRQSCSYLPCW